MAKTRPARQTRKEKKYAELIKHLLQINPNFENELTHLIKENIKSGQCTNTNKQYEKECLLECAEHVLKREYVPSNSCKICTQTCLFQAKSHAHFIHTSGNWVKKFSTITEGEATLEREGALIQRLRELSCKCNNKNGNNHETEIESIVRISYANPPTNNVTEASKTQTTTTTTTNSVRETTQDEAASVVSAGPS